MRRDLPGASLQQGACGLGTRASSALRETLAENDSLQELVLSNNGGMGDFRCAEVCRGLAGNTGLRKIGLADCGFGAQASGELRKALERNGSLQELALSGNSFMGDSACAEVWRGLRKNTSVRRIDMEKCGLGPEASDALRRALARNEALQEILLFDNSSMGDSGCAEVCKGLCGNTSVRRVDLGKCGFDRMAREAREQAGNGAVDVVL